MQKELIAWLEKRIEKSLNMDREIYYDLVALLNTLKKESWLNKKLYYITLMQDEIVPAEMEAFIDHLDAQESRERDEFLVDEMENLAYGEAVMTEMTVW